jgi:hypothetical protein
MASMQVEQPSSKVLTVTTTGSFTFIGIAAIAVVHAFVLSAPLAQLAKYHTHYALVGAMIVFSVLAYVLLFVLALGPYRETITYVFDANACRVDRERSILGKWTLNESIAFKDFVQFEFAPPEAGGFLRLALPDGTKKMLFRFSSSSDFHLLQRLGDITHKKFVLVHEK